MKRILRIGIVDDDSAKITQIMTNLYRGIEKASAEKMEKYSRFQFEPIEIELKASLDSMIEEILNQRLHCLLIDYKLQSRANIDYSGIDLAVRLEKILYDFPIYILTSYDDDLFNNEIYSTYKVFDFERYMKETFERNEIHYKIIEEILVYEKKKLFWEERLKTLLPQAGTSAEVDSEILELDSKLERSIDGRSAIPDHIKSALRSDKLSELIEKIDEILRGW